MRKQYEIQLLYECQQCGRQQKERHLCTNPDVSIESRRADACLIEQYVRIDQRDGEEKLTQRHPLCLFHECYAEASGLTALVRAGTFGLCKFVGYEKTEVPG